MDLLGLICFITSFMWLVLAVIVGIVADEQPLGCSWFLLGAESHLSSPDRFYWRCRDSRGSRRLHRRMSNRKLHITWTK